MRVQRLVMPGSGAVSWTVLDDELVAVPPVERYLAHLAAIERIRVPRAAHGGVGGRGGGRRLGVRALAARLGGAAGNVIVLDASAAWRSEATVNRHLAAVFGFYDFHARAG